MVRVVEVLVGRRGRRNQRRMDTRRLVVESRRISRGRPSSIAWRAQALEDLRELARDRGLGLPDIGDLSFERTDAPGTWSENRNGTIG
jgi:hypothetical protein